METMIAVIHILTALILIALILVQDSKSGSLGGAFAGGGSNSVFGATGATTLAQKMTRGAAVVFALTSILLTISSARSHKSVIDSIATPPPAAESAPAAATGAGTTAPADANPASAPAETAPAGANK